MSNDVIVNTYTSHLGMLRNIYSLTIKLERTEGSLVFIGRNKLVHRFAMRLMVRAKPMCRFKDVYGYRVTSLY